MRKIVPSLLFKYCAYLFVFIISICTISPTASQNEFATPQGGGDSSLYLVRDIATTNGDSSPQQPVLLNGSIYFVASQNVDRVLWKHNPANGDVVAVKRFNSIGSPLYRLGNMILFLAEDGSGSGDFDLWKSDGTTSGTVFVKDTDGSNDNGFPINELQFEQAGNYLYFVATNGSDGFELWRTNGTTGGTIQLKDIAPNSQDSEISELTAVNNTLYFVAQTNTEGREVWKSDGTPSGTQLVANIGPNSTPSNPQFLTAYDNKLYFQAELSGIPYLWRSNGTEAGTVRVQDQLTNFIIRPEAVVGTDSYLFFSALSDDGRELWRSDGTNEGTEQVANIAPDDADATPLFPTPFLDGIVFTAVDGTAQRDLWHSDGTVTGTAKISAIGSGFSTEQDPQFTAVNNTLYFEAYTAETGYELWQTDGTSANTSIVQEFLPNSESSRPEKLTAINDTLFFSVISPKYSRELWKISGGAPQLVADIEQHVLGAFGGLDFSPVTLGNEMYFWANDGVRGTSIWRSDGSTVGTEFVFDSFPTQRFDFPSRNFTTDSMLYFSDTNTETAALNDYMLRAYDPETETVNELGDFNPDSGSNLGDVLLFGDSNGLWRSEGTAVSTTQLTSGAADHLVTLNNIVLFNGTGSNGQELWVSDGTMGGTQELMDIYSGSTGSNPDQLTVVDDMVYFVATDETAGRELWVSDGTVGGTQRAVDLSDPGDSYYQYLTPFQDQLVFTAEVNGAGAELFITDGTAMGTTQLTNINGDPHGVLANSSGIFFVANDGVHGREIWFSDGTVSGTQMVKDVNPNGDATTQYQTAQAVHEDLYFISLDDGTHGVEYWMSDGTEAGTRLIGDINPNGDSAPRFLIDIGYVNGTVFFSADNGEIGGELWGLELSPPKTAVNPTTSAPQEVDFGQAVESITIPPGSLPSNAAQIQYSNIVELPENQRPPNDAGVLFALTLLDGSNNEIVAPTFSPPLTAVVNYDPLLIPDGIEEETLLVYRFDESTGTWQSLTTVSRDLKNNQITVQIGHFSNFAIGSEGAVQETPTLYLPIVVR